MVIYKFCSEKIWSTRTVNMLYSYLCFRSCILSLVCSTYFASAQNVFNVYIQDPIFRQSPTVNRGDDVEDYFGFAVTLHQVEEVQPGDDMMTVVEKTKIIVGAPKGTFPGGLDLIDHGQPAINRTGLVYACSITPQTMCQAVLGDESLFQNGDQINNDGLHGAGRLFDHRPNAQLSTDFSTVFAESKEDQLMGATLYSNGDTFVVCAPAWTVAGRYSNTLTSPSVANQLNPNNRLTKGRCYWTQRNLTQVSFLDPCNSPIGIDDVTQDEGQTYCTSGTDVTVISRGANPRLFVIGVPGYDYGKGALFWGSNQVDLEDRTTGNNIGVGNIRHPSADNTLLEYIEMSQGFQVTSGYVTEPRMALNPPPNIVTSAPRYERGYIGRVDVYDVNNIDDLVEVSASGQQMAEFFGYSLETVDFNSDSYDEVVVGAPFYSQINSDSVVPEIGRVYIFINTKGNLSSEPIVFQGRAPKGRFGMSLINLGDIDQDGYEDVAVGAPYEDGGTSSSGAVYVYYGQPNWTTFKKQSPHKITAQEIADRIGVESLSTFGFSMAGKVDVDVNQYYDLVIGAYESKAIVLLRSLPVADINMKVMTTNNITKNKKDCYIGSNVYICFDVKIEVNYTGRGLTGPLNVMVSLREERSNNNEQRLFFNRSVSQTELLLALQPDPTFETTTTVYVNDPIINTVLPLKIVGTVLQNELPSPNVSNGNPEIKNLHNYFRIRLLQSATVEVDFMSNCGEDNVCITDISLEVKLIEFLPLERGYVTIEQGGVKSVRFTIVMNNNGNEEAIGNFLQITHSRPGVYSEKINLTIESDTTLCSSPCHIQDLPPGQKMTLVVVLSVQPIITVGDIETLFNLTSYGIEGDTEVNNTQNVTLTVERRADLFVTASFTTSHALYMNTFPQALQERSDVGVLTSLEIEVYNVGSSILDNIKLQIYYPAASSGTGEYFFLLPECAVTKDSRTTCDTHVLQAISPLPCNTGKRRKRHTMSPAVKLRRRNAKAAINQQYLSDSTYKYVRRQLPSDLEDMNTLNCKRSQDQCLLINCHITGLQGQGTNPARVVLRGYVDERFFAGKSSNYHLTSYVTAYFNETFEQATDDGEASDESEALLILLQSSGGDRNNSVSELLLFIIPPILAAIIIFIVLLIILYYCGFFRRRIRKPTQHKAQIEVTENESAKQ